jgi:hypothetical protein
MRPLARLILIAALLSAIACSTQPKPAPQATASDETSGVDSRQEGPNAVTKVPMSDVPQVVQAAFTKARPDAKVTQIERETYKNGAVHYNFGYVGADGRKSDVAFDAAGTLAEQ